MPVSAKIRAISFIFCLRGVEHLVGDGRDLVLQRVGIDALALARHARAPFPRRVQILHRRIDRAR